MNFFLAWLATLGVRHRTRQLQHQRNTLLYWDNGSKSWLLSWIERCCPDILGQPENRKVEVSVSASIKVIRTFVNSSFFEQMMLSLGRPQTSWLGRHLWS